MPDLTFHTAWTCETNEDWSTTVPSSKAVLTYTVSYERLFGATRHRAMSEFGYTCTCTGFQVRGTCKHVRVLEAQDRAGTPDQNPGQTRRCAWDSENNSGGQLEPVRVDGEMCCPCCHRPARPYRFGA